MDEPGADGEGWRAGQSDIRIQAVFAGRCTIASTERCTAASMPDN